MYIVTATVDGRQLPTFFLDKDVSGIVSLAQAESLAREIIGRDASVHVENLEGVAAFYGTWPGNETDEELQRLAREVDD